MKTASSSKAPRSNSTHGSSAAAADGNTTSGSPLHRASFGGVSTATASRGPTPALRRKERTDALAAAVGARVGAIADMVPRVVLSSVYNPSSAPSSSHTQSGGTGGEGSAERLRPQPTAAVRIRMAREAALRGGDAAGGPQPPPPLSGGFAPLRGDTNHHHRSAAEGGQQQEKEGVEGALANSTSFTTSGSPRSIGGLATARYASAEGSLRRPLSATAMDGKGGSGGGKRQGSSPQRLGSAGKRRGDHSRSCRRRPAAGAVHWRWLHSQCLRRVPRCHPPAPRRRRPNEQCQ